MHWRERDIRRRVALWRQRVAEWWRYGWRRPQARTEAEIRARVNAFLRLSTIQRVMMANAEYADLSDQAFLLGLLDDRDRIIAHFERAPTAPMPAVPPWPGDEAHR